MRQRSEHLAVTTRRGLMGVYLWEHRSGSQRRQVTIHLMGE